MKYFFRSIVPILALVLSACGGSPATEIARVPTPTQAMPVSTDGTVAASAVVVPESQSELGFLVSGLVKEVNVKEGDKVSAGQVLMTLDVPELYFQVTQAEAALRSAQADAEMQRYSKKTINQNGKVTYVGGPHELQQMADAKALQAQAALEYAKISLAQGALLAPYEGTIIKINVVAGQYIQPGQIAIVLGATGKLQIETTDLNERDIPSVKIGQDVLVFVEALNEEFNGKVTAISPVADTVGGDVVYKVTIKLDQTPDDLLWGMSAEAKINVAP